MIKRIISATLALIMALSVMTSAAYANTKWTNVSDEGTTSQAQMAVIESYGKYIYAKFSYEDSSGNLDKAIDDFFKTYVPKVSDLNSVRAQQARASALAGVYTALARNPEDGDRIVAEFNRLAGDKQPNAPECVQVAAAESMATLVERIFARPDKKEALLGYKDILSPEITDLTTEQMQLARAHSIGVLFIAVARQPERKDELVELFNSLYGTVQPNPSYRVQGAYARSFGKILEMVCRIPELTDMAKELFLSQTPKITDFDRDEVQVGRALASMELYEAIARQPELKDSVVNLFEEFLGKKLDNPSNMVEGAYAFSYSEIIIGMARQPEMRVELLKTLDRISPKVDAFDSEEVQIGRAFTLSDVYESAARQPEMKDIIVNDFIDLLSTKPTATSEIIDGAYMYSNKGYLKAITRQPEMEDKLTSLKYQLAPQVTNFESECVQIARAKIINEHLVMLADAIAEDPRLDSKITEVIGKAVPIHAYSVKFDSNGAGEMENSIVYNNTALNEPSVYKDGYKLVGWYNGDELYDFSSPVKSNLVLSAKWELLPTPEDDIVVDDVKSPETGSSTIYLMLGIALALGVLELVTIKKKKDIKA